MRETCDERRASYEAKDGSFDLLVARVGVGLSPSSNPNPNPNPYPS